MPYLADWFFLSIFKEEPFSLLEIPTAAILNSAQWTVGIDDVSWLLAPIFALWIRDILVNMSQILPYHLNLEYSSNDERQENTS